LAREVVASSEDPIDSGEAEKPESQQIEAVL